MKFIILNTKNIQKNIIMEKKIGDIIEAFENYRFEDALRQIDQLKKKIEKDSKKKSSLS